MLKACCPARRSAHTVSKSLMHRLIADSAPSSPAIRIHTPEKWWGPLTGTALRAHTVSIIDMSPFFGDVQLHLHRTLASRVGRGFVVPTPFPPAQYQRLRDSRVCEAPICDKPQIEGRVKTQTGQIVKQFQEIRCSWKSLSSNELRNILHVVSRNIDKIAPLNGGA